MRNLPRDIFECEQVEAVMSGKERFVRANHPDLGAQIKRLENGPRVDHPIIVRLSGSDIDTLYRMSDEATDFLFTLPGVSDIKNTWGCNRRS